MQRILPGASWPLYDVAGIRRIERAAASRWPPHALMQRAGLAVARLALALAPHARTVWVACGPGNNGGDGLEAALHLKAWGRQPVVTWLGDASRLPPDARISLRRARDAGVAFAPQPPSPCDFAIDALLGIGAARAVEGPMKACIDHLDTAAFPVLAVDLPSGLSCDTGQGASVRASHTLSLLALKPGLFTGRGRDAAGQIWFDDLGVTGADAVPCACLSPRPAPAVRPHASHKGSFGDVAVVGGAAGMTGAALLAASAALHHGAGRVYAALLDGGRMAVDAQQPELMIRGADSLDLQTMAVACGCGGGDAVREVLPRVLSTAGALVLDADALNAIALQGPLQSLLRLRGRRHDCATVLTPHPLEAARLLGADTAAVQADRLAAAHALSARFGCVAVLKGSGTVIASPNDMTAINPTGNGRLATAGTGDVLAGWIAARLAGGASAFDAACAAVYAHGLAADRWSADAPLTASALARAP